MPIDLILSPERTNNPLEAARRSLIQALVRMDVPAPYGSWPVAEDHEAVRDHIYEASKIFDAWLKEIGREVNANAAISVDSRLFDGQFFGAVDGNATFELERLAEVCREERAECVA
jgi:hypothetical protein